MNLLPEPPVITSARWLRKFAKTLMTVQPRLGLEEAIRCALLAHQGTWLLEADEAAELWMTTVATRRVFRRLPRRLLG